MNNTERKLDALIDALGFDVEVTDDAKEMYLPHQVDDDGKVKEGATPAFTHNRTVYKLTKREDAALSLLREIVNSDPDHVNEYNLGVGLFKKINDLVGKG